MKSKKTCAFLGLGRLGTHKTNENHWFSLVFGGRCSFQSYSLSIYFHLADFVFNHLLIRSSICYKENYRIYGFVWLVVSLTLIVMGGGGYLGHATQNLVNSARVRKIITLIIIKEISLFDTES